MNSQFRQSRELRVPDDAERIFQADVWRRNSHHEWTKKNLILTKEDLLLSYDKRDYVIEKIPLVTIDYADSEEKRGLLYLTLTSLISTKLRPFQS